jgi:carotenoid cleavage dioxygenase
VYAPVPGSEAENDGWVLCLVHNETMNKSKLVIIDAGDFSAPPVASIELPYAVPYGAHGNWIADQQMR